MNDLSLKMIKGIMVLLVVSMVVIMVAGMSVLKSSYYMHASFYRMQWDWAKTEVEFFNYQYGGPLKFIAYRQSRANSVPAGVQTSTNSIPILLYHGVIADPNWKPDEVNLTVDEFRDNMFALKAAGYQTITVEDYLAFINGKKTLPKRSFLLTFDDGRKDSFYNADPILRTVGYTAVMNIITGRSLGVDNEKGTFHISETEIKQMISSGRWEMESHGRDDHDYEAIGPNGEQGHFLTNKVWLPGQNRMETDAEYTARIKNDLIGSKLDIEKDLGVKALAFAYPFGDYGQQQTNFPRSRQILTAITDAIYPVTFTQVGSSDFPTNYAVDHSPLAKRISVSSEMSTKSIIDTLEQSQDKPVTYSDDFSYNKGWLQGWGYLGISGNTLTIRDTAQDDSSLAFLGGSYLWNDYRAQASVNVINGNSFTLAGRYRDGSNYMACDYYDNRVALNQKVNGHDSEEIDVQVLTRLNGAAPVGVGISISGNNASCLLDGTAVISGPIDPNLKYGGISFKIWDSIGGGAELRIKNLTVTGIR